MVKQCNAGTRNDSIWGVRLKIALPFCFSSFLCFHLFGNYSIRFCVLSFICLCILPPFRSVSSSFMQCKRNVNFFWPLLYMYDPPKILLQYRKFCTFRGTQPAMVLWRYLWLYLAVLSEVPTVLQSDFKSTCGYLTILLRYPMVLWRYFRVTRDGALW